jgi:hypothetical protein
VGEGGGYGGREAVALRLDVVITPGGTAFTVGELAQRLPELGIEIAPRLERAPICFVGAIQIDDEDDDDSKRRVMHHLETLRAFSKSYPDVAISIGEPDGGTLRLEGGSFGDDEADLVAMFHDVPDERWRLLVSFRLAPDGHGYLLGLVSRAVPGTLSPVVDASEAGLALGFDIAGDADRVADILGALRMAWRQEGSEVECLIEVEGSQPALTVARVWSDWVELEKSLRRGRAITRTPGAAMRSPDRLTVLAEVASSAPVLGSSALSWIDSDDQILCLAGGKLYALPERFEIGDPRTGGIVTRGDGSLLFVSTERRFDIPPPRDDGERRLHGTAGSRALLTDTVGSGDGATTRFMLVSDRGLDEGLELRCVRGIDVWDHHAYVLAGDRDDPRLLSIDLYAGWSYSSSKPWRNGEATDVAAISNARVAITTQHGQRSTLHLVERHGLSFSRTIALPCIAPQIVGHGVNNVWITGLAPGGDGRCDLFRVALATGKVIVETAEIFDVQALDVACNDVGNAAVVAARQAVWAITVGREPRELVLLGADQVTGIACARGDIDPLQRTQRDVPAVLLRDRTSARLVLGLERVIVPLDTPGHAPLFIDPIDHDLVKRQR